MGVDESYAFVTEQLPETAPIGRSTLFISLIYLCLAWNSNRASRPQRPDSPLTRACILLRMRRIACLPCFLFPNLLLDTKHPCRMFG